MGSKNYALMTGGIKLKILIIFLADGVGILQWGATNTTKTLMNPHSTLLVFNIKLRLIPWSNLQTKHVPLTVVEVPWILWEEIIIEKFGSTQISALICTFGAYDMWMAVPKMLEDSSSGAVCYPLGRAACVKEGTHWGSKSEVSAAKKSKNFTNGKHLNDA